MGKQRVLVAPNESDDNDENIEVEEISEYEEDVEEDPEEEPSEEELFEGNSCEDEPNEEEVEEEVNEEESSEVELDEGETCDDESNQGEEPSEEELFEGNSCEDEPNEEEVEEEVNEEEPSKVEPDEGETCDNESNQGEEPCEYLSEEEEPDEEVCNEEEDPSEDDVTEEPCEEDVEEDLSDSDDDYKENQRRYNPSSSDRKRAAGGLEFNVQKKQKQGPCEGDPTEAPYNPSSSDRKRGADILECNSQKKPKQNLNLGAPNKVIRDDIFPEKQESTGGSGKKKRRSRWDIVGEKAAEKKKSRWASDEKQLKLLGPLKLPDCVKGVVPEGELDPEIWKLNEQLGIINAKLLSREVVAIDLVEQRNKIIADLIKRNPTFKPPRESKPIKFLKKLYVPVKEFPDYNFIGLILGPRGRTQKRMEKETGALIRLRGKGSKKLPAVPHIDDYAEDLHVHIEADNQESLDAAVAMVEKILTPVEEKDNLLKRNQLMELSKLKEHACKVCGSMVHLTGACPLTAPTNESQQLDSKIGSGLFTPLVPPPAPAPAPAPFYAPGVPQWYPPPFYHPAPPPMAWPPGYSGSVMMPDCYGGFTTSNGFQVHNHPLYQTPLSSSSLVSSGIASSDEFAQFPGFVKSLDSPDARFLR